MLSLNLIDFQHLSMIECESSRGTQGRVNLMLREGIGAVLLPLAFLIILGAMLLLSTRIHDAGTRAAVVTILADVLKMAAVAVIWMVLRA
jgi:hypothetical protein